MTVCRLRAQADTLHARLGHRHVDDESGLEWHLAREGELDGILDAAGVADIEIAVDGLTRDDEAKTVLDAIGWSGCPSHEAAPHEKYSGPWTCN